MNDDGATIEPEYYVPVIPMVLVNGSTGIGSGYSSNVANYNPRDIVANLRRKLNGEPFQAMTPYYYGFEGDVLPDAQKPGKYKISGKIERVDDTTLLITELPLRTWTQDYKQFLETMLTGSDKQPAEIKDFKENHTESTVRFTVVVDKDKLDAFEKSKDGLMGKFKLTSVVSTDNMNLFDPEKHIVKYATPEDIMMEFFQVRLDFYGKRKVMLVCKLEREQCMFSNKARFIEEVCSGDLVVNNRKRKDVLSDLKARGYDIFSNDPMTNGTAPNEPSDASPESDVEDDMSDVDLVKGYDYLLGMKIWSLTFEKAEKIRTELAEKTAELEKLRATSPEQLWLNDLDAVEEALDHRDLEFEASAKEELRAQKKSQKRQTKKVPVGRKKGKKKEEWDSDMEDSEGDEDDDDSVGFTRKLTARRPAPAAKKPAASFPLTKAAAKSTIGAPSSKSTVVAGAKSVAIPVKSSAFSATGLGVSNTANAKSVIELGVDSGSDAELAPRKAAAKKSTAATASKEKAMSLAAADPQSGSDGSDDDAGMGLMARMQKKLALSAKMNGSESTQANKMPVEGGKNFKKRSSPKNDDSDDEASKGDMDGHSDDDFELASVTPAKEKLTKKAPKMVQVAKKARSKAPLKTAKPAPSKKTADDLEFHSDSDEAPDERPAPSRSRSARAATKKPVVYSLGSDEDNSDDECEYV